MLKGNLARVAALCAAVSAAAPGYTAPPPPSGPPQVQPLPVDGLMAIGHDQRSVPAPPPPPKAGPGELQSTDGGLVDPRETAPPPPSPPPTPPQVSDPQPGEGASESVVKKPLMPSVPNFTGEQR